jgi:hypothetical protein
LKNNRVNSWHYYVTIYGSHSHCLACFEKVTDTGNRHEEAYSLDLHQLRPRRQELEGSAGSATEGSAVQSVAVE